MVIKIKKNLVRIIYEGNKAWNGCHNDGLAHFEVWLENGEERVYHKTYDCITGWYNIGLAETRQWCNDNGYEIN